jgi:hypothetical protein
MIGHRDVAIIDNLATGRREKIEHLLDHPRVTFAEGSITDLDLLKETFPGADGILAIPGVDEGFPLVRRFGAPGRRKTRGRAPARRSRGGLRAGARSGRSSWRVFAREAY